MDKPIQSLLDLVVEKDDGSVVKHEKLPNGIDTSLITTMITDLSANTNLTATQATLQSGISHLVDRASPTRRLATNKWRLGVFTHVHGMWQSQTGTAPFPSHFPTGGGTYTVFNPHFWRRWNAIFQPQPTTSIAFPCSRFTTSYSLSTRTIDQERRSYTHIDVPGTNIGSVFNHPVGRTALFSEASIIPSSQGVISAIGPYETAEKDLGHMAYNFIFHDAGGTGDVVTSGTGATLTAPANVFVASAPFTAPMAASGNHFVTLSNPTNGVNRGVFKITAFIDTQNVTVDAVAISQTLVNETNAGLSWSIRTGPIGTYWMRKQGYRFGGFINAHDMIKDRNYDQLHGFSRWNNDFFIVNPGSGFQNTGAPLSCFQSERDSQGRWWMAFRVAAGGPGTALRTWWHNSSETYRSPYREGTGTFNVGGAADPGTTALCTGVAIDQNGYVWTTWRGGTLSVIVINPVTDTVVATYTAQSYVNTVGASSQPLSLNTRRIMFDALRNRMYVFHDEGHSYTDDGGATWSRLRINAVGTGTVTITGTSTAVVGVGTTFSTQVAAGDWIKIGGDTTYYRVASITDDLNLTLATAHTAVAGVAFTTGQLTSNTMVLGSQTGGASTDTHGPVNANLNMFGVSPCDYGDDGYLYWVARDYNSVHRWSGNDVSDIKTLANSNVPVNGSVAAGNTQANQFHQVIYNRVNPGDTAGGGTRVFKSKLFITGGSTGIADLGNNWIGICMVDPAVYGWAGANLVYGTSLWRWHPTFVDTFASGIMDVPVTTFESRASLMIDRATGHMNAIISQSAVNAGTYWFGQHPSNNTGVLTQDSTGSLNSGGAYSQLVRLAEFAVRYEADPFDSSFWLFGHTDQASLAITDLVADLINLFHMKRDYRWNGTAWATGYAASQANGQVGQNSFFLSPVVGAGLKRMHHWNEPIGEGVQIKFTDTIAVAQASQFVAEENATVTACYGVLKGHQDRVTANIYSTMASTFVRVNSEVKKTAKKAQSMLTGFTPMWRTTGATETTDALEMFKDGPGDLRSKIMDGQNGRPPTATANYGSTPAGLRQQHGVLLNYTHEQEFNDGQTGSGTNVFTSPGYSFQSSDVGKTISIYLSAQGNNGPAVITGPSGGPFPSNSVTVNKTFSVTAETTRAWKLRNYASIGQVQFGSVHFGTNNAGAQNILTWLASCNHVLFKSYDGITWTLVKQYMGPVSTIPTDATSPLCYATPMMLSNEVNMAAVGGNLSSGGDTSNRSQGHIWTYDLSDLPVDDTRAPYWKVTLRNNITFAQGANPFQPVGWLQLRDRSGVRLGVPVETRCEDANDPSLMCFIPTLSLMYRASGAATASTVSDGDLNAARTNLVNFTGANFYLQQGTDGVGNGTTTFTSATAVFTPLHTGLKIRIHDATNPTNNGWATIITVNSATSVVLSRSLIAETLLDWELLNIGNGDLIRFILAAYDLLSNQPDNDTYFTILDVPTTNSVTLTANTAPMGLTNVDWEISTNVGATGNYQSNLVGTAMEYGAFSGRIDWPENLIFATIASGATGNSLADTDADGTTETFRLTSASIDLTTNVVAGDVLVVVKAGVGFGSRYMPITATPTLFAGTQYDVVTAYDEYSPSQTLGSWAILRPLPREYRLARYITVVTDLP